MSDKSKLIIALSVITAAAVCAALLVLPIKTDPGEITVGAQQTEVSTAGQTEAKTVTFLPELIGTEHAESYTSLSENLIKLEQVYPDLLEFSTVGKSAAGRELMMIKLGCGGKKALIVGGVHAREHLSTKYLLCCIETYCRAFYTDEGMLGDYDICSLLAGYTLYIIPCVNPDGLEIIRSRDKPAQGVKADKLAEYKANKNGVDINRNFPLAWDKINNGISAPSEYYFKGPSAGSEPETKALTELCAQNAFEFVISVHVKGNCIFWGDMYDTALNGAYKAYAKKIADACALKLTEPTISPNDYGGGFENWFRHTYSHPGFCVELVNNKTQISPLDDKNYAAFFENVNYGCTAFLLAAAMRG